MSTPHQPGFEPQDETTSAETVTRETETAVDGATEDHQLRSGEVIGGRFVIVRFLGKGGMGEVYEASDEELQGKHVAIKTMRPEIVFDATMRERFEREVLVAREITHRNVCPTYNLFRMDGPRGPIHFLEMKLLRGESLAARLKRVGKMPEAALSLARQLAEGLDAAHSAGVIHRDFKPGNVMLEGSGAELHAIITDFGVSRFYNTGQHAPAVREGIRHSGLHGARAPAPRISARLPLLVMSTLSASFCTKCCLANVRV